MLKESEIRELWNRIKSLTGVSHVPVTENITGMVIVGQQLSLNSGYALTTTTQHSQWNTAYLNNHVHDQLNELNTDGGPSFRSLTVQGVTNDNLTRIDVISQGGTTPNKELAHFTLYNSNYLIEPAVRIRKAVGTYTAPTIIGYQEGVGSLYFQGYTGASKQDGFTNAGFVRFEAHGTPSAGTPTTGYGILPGRFRFTTYKAGADDSTSQSNANIGMNMLSNGYVGFGLLDPQYEFDLVGTARLGTLSGIVIGTAGVLSTITDSSANWDTAYGWGNHASAGYLTSVTAHDLLSATHGDTLADTVVAGDLMVGNATPKWSRLAKGDDDKILKMVSGVPTWSTPPSTSIAHNDTTSIQGGTTGEYYHFDSARYAELLDTGSPDFVSVTASNGGFYATTAANGDSALSCAVSGMSNAPFFIEGQGRLMWGSGSSAIYDTILFRNTANQLGTNGGFIINEDGNAVDTRIESADDANMFFIDGTNNRIGVGTQGTENAKLHIWCDCTTQISWAEKFTYNNSTLLSSAMSAVLFNVNRPSLVSNPSLTNGSFEVDGSSQSSPTGWTLTGDTQYGATSETQGAYQGTWAYAIGKGATHTADTALFQDITTQVGGIYTITFYTAVYGTLNRTQVLKCEAKDGATVLNSVTVSKSITASQFDGSLIVWGSSTLQFTATSTTTRIVFTDQTTSTNSNATDMMLDSISIVANNTGSSGKGAFGYLVDDATLGYGRGRFSFLQSAVNDESTLPTVADEVFAVYNDGLIWNKRATKANNATGVLGQICWDASYIYVCTATNTWKRVALSTF